MKQIMQNLENGTTMVVECPVIKANDDTLLIQTTTSLISLGTERMLVDFGKASYLQKARQQPEKVKMVLEKVKTDGLLTTIEAVQSKLAKPLPLGYSNVGVVVESGKNITGFKAGDRVVSNGPHADMVQVPKHLCAIIPDQVDDESAAFTIVASIGLQGIRLANPSLGESFAVIGAGLIGLLTIQLLKAHGCRVLAIDFDEKKLDLARQFGAETCNPSQGEDAIAAGLAFSRGCGMDGVLLTAATQSSDPVTQAARMSRKRGRIVLVGVTGLSLNRADFYEKELSFQVSCSYGPGRYDADYEEKGLDYPIGFVRWTEQRNFEAVLDMMAHGQLQVKPLITHRYLFEKAPQAYETVSNDKTALGILLSYTSSLEQRCIQEVPLSQKTHFNPEKPVLGVIGAGNYASRILLPAFKKAGAQFHTIVSAGGVNSVIQGNANGFTHASSDWQDMLEKEAINTVVIATRHDSHAKLTLEALKKGNHVFVEKPLCLHQDELDAIKAVCHLNAEKGKSTRLMVGFNRRFSKHAQKIKQLLATVKEPKSFIITVNAGFIPPDHWTQDKQIGGGRILGEACHFIDLMRFFAGCEISRIQAEKMGKNDSMQITEDKAVITLRFADGSFGTIHYLANGASNFPKERIEIFTAGRVLQLDNFRKLTGYGWPGFKRMNLWKQDKGQQDCCKAFLENIEKGQQPLIPLEEILEVSRVTIEAALLLQQAE